MSKDGYLWWKQRLQNMAQYFTAYRVDHILGFFRIFQIPEKHVAGVLGHFKPSRPLFQGGLENMGLWDLQRLSDPYVPVAHLRQELGEDADEAIGKYFYSSGSDMLQFKPAFRSERVIEAIPTPPDSPEWLQQVCSYIHCFLLCAGSSVSMWHHMPSKILCTVLHVGKQMSMIACICWHYCTISWLAHCRLVRAENAEDSQSADAISWQRHPYSG